MYIDRCAAYELRFVLINATSTTPSAGGDERHERQDGKDAHDGYEAGLDFDRLHREREGEKVEWAENYMKVQGVSYSLVNISLI